MMINDKENIEQENKNKQNRWKKLLGLNPTCKLNSKSDIYNILVLFLTVLCFVFVVFSVYKISKYNLIEHDDFDIFFSTAPGTILDKYFIKIYKAKIISNFLIIFSGYDLPKMLNYNLTAWIQSGGAVIKGCFWAILCILLSSTIFLFNKKNLLFPFIFAFTYIFLQLHYTKQFRNELYAAFYCFTFPFIFYILFWNKFITIYIKDGSVTKKDRIFLIIFGILTGLSAEITAASTFVSLLLLYVSNNINKIGKNKLFKYSFISTLTGNCFYFLSPNFINNAKGYGTFISFRQTIDNAISIFPEYISGYKNTFFNYYLNYLIVICILSIIIYIFVEKNLRKKMLLLIFSLISGSFTFFTALLFAGKPMNHTAVIHYDIIAQMIILFVYVIYFQLNCLFQNKKIFYTSIIVILSAMLLNNYDQLKQGLINKDFTYNNLTYNSIDKYRENYIHEFILGYYAYSNKPAIIYPFNELETDELIYNYMLYYNKNYNLNNKITLVNSPDEAINEFYKMKGGGKKDI